MSQTDVDTMPAGFRLDRLLAEALGMTLSPDKNYVLIGSDWECLGLDWKPSVDIADAWPVLEKVKKLGYKYISLTTGDWLGDLWQCSLSDVWRQVAHEGDMHCFANAETPELAICRAALKATAHLERTERR